MAQQGDPGYKATSVLLGECGLALAFDSDKLSDLRGVLTPASFWRGRMDCCDQVGHRPFMWSSRLSSVGAMLAGEVGPDGIRANVVAPGLVGTARIVALAQARGMGNAEHVAGTPLRRLGEPDEIAKVVQFFASDLASYVTGQCLAVTGGLGSVAC